MKLVYKTSVKYSKMEYVNDILGKNLKNYPSLQKKIFKDFCNNKYNNILINKITLE